MVNPAAIHNPKPLLYGASCHRADSIALVPKGYKRHLQNFHEMPPFFCRTPRKDKGV